MAKLTKKEKAIIADAEHRCTVRLFPSDPGDLYRQLDDYCAIFGATNAEKRKGMRFNVAERYGTFPGAYRGTPYQSYARVEHNGRRWVIVRAWRDIVNQVRVVRRFDDQLEPMGDTEDMLAYSYRGMVR